MKRTAIVTAALFAALTAPAFASDYQSSRGADNLSGAEVWTDTSESGEAMSTQNAQSNTSDPSFERFNERFGTPEDNFESGRR